MDNLDSIRTEEQKRIAAQNREFWGNYFNNKPKRTHGDLAVRIASAKIEHGAEGADQWMKEALAHKAREQA